MTWIAAFGSSTNTWLGIRQKNRRHNWRLFCVVGL